ncbi:MAG: acetolactate synthase, large subunit, biosynthetic type, acetolactate synthase I/II/III large subunit [Candidatus Gottesmanbacteria bacterium GW2011_GWA2_43_14]|uniref:Acetolactate synthase n=1 Tax=Candidatus Gottesmanbacteria bacterium GW2011_GWA2_43_14 TaxID=1618443 RepID=A0A0G1DE05_9BACT|nr:MAG: acetolactate synthase, large subunit, biosynthetic type, acetolactate synthase I/II/III large subunit [Candidatus Gottesmanbacteria bacterium GW2011_GWA2_43_14]
MKTRLKQGQKVQGAEIICECLLRAGVTVIFGYPGGANIPIYDALYKYPELRHILVRHEQGAAHAAEGYAWATGRPGVCFATSGPGATNLITGLADAMLDSIPMVCITGQVPSPLLGSDAFQEADILGMTLPVTKHNYLVTRADDIADVFAEAFYLAVAGRPGPVLIDITKDAQVDYAEFRYKENRDRLKKRLKLEATEEEIGQISSLLNEALRPLIVAGHGILLSGDGKTLLSVAEKQDIPVTLTQLGLSAIPHDHRLFMGMPGMHGNVAANRAPLETDVLLAVGMRFHDRVTSKVSAYAPQAKIIHIDIDPSEIGKNVMPHLGVVGDAKAVLGQLLPKLKSRKNPGWLKKFEAWKSEEQKKVFTRELLSPKLKSAQVIDEIARQTGFQATIVADVGQNQMYAARYYQYRKYNTHFTSGGLGTMGFALPAGMGAKLGDPGREVWIVIGDGGIQMTLQELATIVQEKTEVKIALLNNNYLGMVRQWQELFYKGNYSEVKLKNPNFQKLCEGFGISSLKAENLKETKEAINIARKSQGPFLIEFTVEAEENVFPMIPAGAGIGEMVVSLEELSKK